MVFPEIITRGDPKTVRSRPGNHVSASRAKSCFIWADAGGARSKEGDEVQMCDVPRSSFQITDSRDIRAGLAILD